MPPDQVCKYLWDVQQAATLLTEFVSGKSFAQYEADAMLRSAVERQFEIIGEAMSQLARLDPETVRRISNYPRIIGFRNILIHGYAEVQNERVWATIRDDVPILIAEVSDLLTEE